MNFLPKNIYEELENFEKFLRAELKSDVSLLDLALKYVFHNKGKRVRPMLVFLFAEALGGINKRTFTGASMIEILHTASLVHDDVVDRSDTRRGQPSVNAVWKNQASVLIGDYLFAKGLLIATSHEEYKFLNSLSRAVQRISEAELLQIQKSKEMELDESTYFKIIAGKTASLLASSCEVGALSVDSGDAVAQKANNYGELVGIAFQIRDDMLDYSSDGAILGKPIGNDIKEKKITLPLLYALKQTSPKTAKSIVKMIKADKITKTDVKYVIDFAKDNGGMEYASSKSKEYAERAKLEIADIAGNPAGEALIKFADFVVERVS